MKDHVKTYEYARSLIEASLDPLFVISKEGKIIDMNEALVNVTHKTREQLLGSNFDNYFSEPANAREVYKEVLKKGFVVNSPLTIIDGVLTDVLFNGSVYKDKDGDVLGAVVIARDISEKKKDEQAKKLEYNNLKALIDNTHDFMWSIDSDFKLMSSNKAFNDIVKFMTGRVLEKGSDSLSTGFSAQQIERYKGYYERAFLGETFVVEEHALETSSSTPYDFWTEISFNPILHDGQVVGTACFSRNITERKHAEDLIVESESKYRAFFENSMDGILITVTDGDILDANPAACKIFQMTKEEICEAGRYKLADPSDSRLAELIEKRQNFGSAKGELTLVRKDGSKFAGELSSSVFIDSFGQKRTSMIVRDVSDRKRALQKILKQKTELRNLFNHLQSIREEERAHIATEIHDELGQQLTLLKMDIGWIMYKFKSADNEINEKLKEMLVFSDKLIATIRKISTDLRPAIINDLGLVAALEWQCSDFEEKTGITCHFSSSIKERKFENNFSITAYRILQESLTNVIRHAKAELVTILATETETELHMEIIDDGLGFGNEKINTKKSLGILGMKERAAMLGGKLTIEGKENIGTKTKLILPFKNEHTDSR